MNEMTIHHHFEQRKEGWMCRDYRLLKRSRRSVEISE